MAPFQLATKTGPIHQNAPSAKTWLFWCHEVACRVDLFPYLCLFVLICAGLGGRKSTKNYSEGLQGFCLEGSGATGWKVRTVQGGRIGLYCFLPFGRYRVQGSDSILCLFGRFGLCRVGGSDSAGFLFGRFGLCRVDGSDASVFNLPWTPTKTSPHQNTSSTKYHLHQKKHLLHLNTPSTNKAPLPPKCHLTILMRCHGFGFLGHDLYKLICSRALARLFVLIWA